VVSPTPRTLLFAALEAQDSSRPYDWDTVAIAGLDGAAQMGGTSNLIYHSVRRADGTEIWGSRAAAGQPYQDPFVSPHGDRVVAGVGGGGIAAIVSSLGDRVALGIHPLGCSTTRL
jgi:hypothetical protein